MVRDKKNLAKGMKTLVSVIITIAYKDIKYGFWIKLVSMCNPSIRKTFRNNDTK